ncbi:MAG: amino acid permease-associated region [Rubrobacteraceae bacterium]|nr:amino acid permease-associated region [Rubrobacteraceae bacterium]
MDESVSHVREHPDLKRGIGPWLLLFFVLGDIVGAGIYALVGEVGALVGGAIWSAFLCAFVLAIFTASSYAELVTKYPRAGGSATYVNNAFRNPFISFMVAFAVMASGITSACTLTLAFSGDYLAQFISVPVIGAAIVFMLLITAINFYGISESVRINVVLTLVEITGLVLIIIIGIAALAGGHGDPGRAFEFKEGTSVLTALLAGTVLAFYALIGFDDSVNVAEETQHPSRNYPRAIFGALLLAGVIYLLVTFTASMVVPTATLAESSGPLLEVVEAGPIAIPTKLFAAIALLAVSNGALINMIMASRIVYGMGDQGVMPTAFSNVHPGRRTPWVSIAFTSIIALLVLITIGRNDEALSTLGSTTVVLLLLAFVMVNISVLVLRRDEVGHEHFRTPTVFPILGAVIAAALLIYQAVSDITVFGLAAVLLAIGVVLYGVNLLAKRSLDRESPQAR